MSNIVDLSPLKGDKPSRQFLVAVDAMAAISNSVRDYIRPLHNDEQRFLMQMAAWHLMGAATIPASANLAHLPLLSGMGMPLIQDVAERLMEADIIDHVFSSSGKNHGFSWTWFRAELSRAALELSKSAIVGTDGTPIR